MDNIPRELLLEIIKYSSITQQPEIEFSVDMHPISYSVNIRIVNGIELIEFFVIPKNNFKKFIRNSISLKFFDFPSIHTKDNLLYLHPSNTQRTFIFPLDKYGPIISSQFKKISQKYEIHIIS